MQTKHGFPVVDANNVFSVLAALGITRRRAAGPAMALSEYLQRDLTESQRSEAERFSPKSEVVTLFRPNNEVFTGFRTVPKDWATTFVMFPGDLVAVVGEYKHGCDDVTLVPPSGVLSKADNGSMTECALRETSEELGVKLDRVIPLNGGCGVPISGRQNTGKYFPFLGVLPREIVVGPSKLDATEDLKIVLIPLMDWLKLIASGQTHEMCVGDVTYAALRQLGRLSVVLR